MVVFKGNEKYFFSNLIYFSTFFFISFRGVGKGIESNISITSSFLFLFLLFFLFYFRDSLKFLDKKKLTSIAFIFFILILSNLFSDYLYNKISWFRLYNIYSCFFLGFITYYFLIKKIIVFSNIIKIVSLLCLTHVFILIIYWFLLDNPRSHNWLMSLPFFNHIRNLTDFLSIGFFCTIFIFQKSIKLKKYVWYFVSIVILSVIVWSGSRTAYFSILLSYLLWLSWVENKIKNLFSFILSIFLAIIFSLLFKVEQSGLGFLRSISRSYTNSLNGISSGRLDIYLKCIDLFFNKPLFGLGGEAVFLSNIHAGTLHITQAHNSIIQVLIEFGVIGFFALCYLFYNFFSELKSSIIKNEQKICVVVILNIFLASLTNGGFYYVPTISLLSIFIACLYFLKNDNNLKAN